MKSRDIENRVWRLSGAFSLPSFGPSLSIIPHVHTQHDVDDTLVSKKQWMLVRSFVRSFDIPLPGVVVPVQPPSDRGRGVLHVTCYG